ncbi:LuxR C-terminal-related transcriptional regulator [Lentzea sp. NPDC051213]|uniref:helix-turn-helix transcriptional regulator n=1 Tax=Lentzea sp. NPDC051213 TaxID=3364126 RepID=UPI0037A73128
MAVYIPGSRWSLRRGARSPQAVSVSAQAIFLANVGGDRAAAIDAAVRVLRGEEGPLNFDSLWQATLALIYSGQATVATDLYLDVVRNAEWVRCEPRANTLDMLLARLRSLVGRYEEASQLLRSMLTGTLSNSMRPMAVAWLTEALVKNGNLAEADELLRQNGFDEAIDDIPDRALVLAARGDLRFAQHRYRAALDDYLTSGRCLDVLHVTNPAVVPWRSRAAFAAARLGHTRVAGRLAVRNLELARRWGSPSTVGQALGLQGHLAEGADGDRLYEEAISLIEIAQDNGELARMLIDFADLLQERGRTSESQARLTHARRIAGRLNNTVLIDEIDQAEQRLAAGATPKLTRQEAKIARLAAAGYSNKQIAEQLFVTIRTVEFHLTATYRKFDVVGRKQLAALAHRL